MNTPECLICGTASEVSRTLSAEYLRNRLGDYYHEPVPPSVHVPGYSLVRCPHCTIEFSDPMTPGDASLYEWLATKPGYYPDFRWEWDVVVHEMKSRSAASIRVLEVGCGSGSFLRLLRNDPAIEAVGLDLEPGAVARCREKGCEAYAEDLADFLRRNPDRRFDHVVAFHCLEHVSHPKEFLRMMLSATAPGGSVFVSTPYSPMSFETVWFDPLNHPPHHMTRWNARSYQELGRVLGCTLTLRMPPAAGILHRARRAIALRKFGTGIAVGRTRMRLAMLSDPGLTLSEIWRQSLRDRPNQSTAADVVLATFSSDSCEVDQRLLTG